MEETRKQIREILDIIENGEESSGGSELSMEQVKAILLQRSLSSGIDQSRQEDCSGRIYRMRENALLNYYHQLPDESSIRMKIGNFIKRVVRKLIRPIMLPLTDAQSRYNLEVQQVLEQLHQREEELVDEQKALRQLVLTMGSAFREGEK